MYPRVMPVEDSFLFIKGLFMRGARGCVSPYDLHKSLKSRNRFVNEVLKRTETRQATAIPVHHRFTALHPRPPRIAW